MGISMPLSLTIMHYFKVLLAVNVKLVSPIASTLKNVKKAVLRYWGKPGNKICTTVGKSKKSWPNTPQIESRIPICPREDLSYL